MERRRFCSKELDATERRQLLDSSFVPDGLFVGGSDNSDETNNNDGDGEYDDIIKRFDTLRYKYKSPRWHEYNPKSILDVSASSR